MNIIQQDNEFGKLSWKVALVPFLFVLFMWMVKYYEVKSSTSLTHYGLYPGNPESLWGLISSPFLHGDLSHLFNNSWSFIVLGSAIAYFYKKLFWPVLIISFFAHGIILYFIGRPSFHIGASGLVYAFAAFLVVSGLLRKHPRLMAASLIVVFLYGSLVWGVLPIVEHMSWEAHLAGSIVGVLLAFLFKNQGPKRKIYDWDEEEDDEFYLSLHVHGVEEVVADESPKHSESTNNPNVQIHYQYKPKN